MTLEELSPQLATLDSHRQARFWVGFVFQTTVFARLGTDATTPERRRDGLLLLSEFNHVASREALRLLGRKGVLDDSMAGTAVSRLVSRAEEAGVRSALERILDLAWNAAMAETS